ncbi:virulence protein [Acidaminococcus fermentans]|uniref:virulence protein n=1 Tax=Acidaminococcus fermentans TaxID=905 RepID=UPI003D01F815
MRINYNVSGERRKKLVGIISEATGAKAEYQFMPTCSYKIGEFTVTKTGSLEYDDDADAKHVLEAIAAAGFEPESSGASDEKKPGLTIEIPLDKVAVGNLTNIFEAKGTLIKKALGINDLNFEIMDDRIAFPWFDELPNADDAKAYIEFISLLCKHSKELERTSSAERPVTNEKYAFRCFLLRLGFIGSEYKASRKILLRNLTGNSSWKNVTLEKEPQA